MPDESTILRFRHLLEHHELAVAIFAEVNMVLSEKGLSMRGAPVVDAESSLYIPSNSPPPRSPTAPCSKTAFTAKKALFSLIAAITRTTAPSSNLPARKAWPFWYRPRNPKGGELTEQQKKSNRIPSAIRAVVEHPFRVIKQQFGFAKVRYRGAKKNTGKIVTLFALANLRMARHRLMPMTGAVRP